MPTWEACITRVEHDDGSPPFEDDDTDVRIEKGRILVCYWDDQGAVLFEGREEAPGRFVLTARSRPRKAELTMEPDGRTLRGTFEEGDLRGSLQIELSGH